MKTPTLVSLCLLSTVAAIAAEPVPVSVNVSDIPPGTSQLVLLIDGATPRAAPNYEDLNPPPAAAAQPAQPNPVQQVLQQVQPAAPNAPAAAAAAAAPADPQQQFQRRRRMAAAAPVVPSVREAIDPQGSTTATVRASVPPGDSYQARVVALRGKDTFPSVVAGGRIDLLKVSADGAAPLQVALKTPSLKLADDTPRSVAPGGHYRIAGTITDGARALGTKNRMRVWLSEGTPPTANYAGRQISTVDVTTEGDDVNFSFELTAPKERTTLYFQFGELPSDFAAADGHQAPFVVLPDLGAGAKPLALKVE
jgi:hypothetical protein